MKWGYQCGCVKYINIDVQIRDLRRTMASWMSCHGENLIAIKEILHHSNVSTTQIYARMDQSAIRSALSRHAERMFPDG